ncbi:MAG TPA: hypothetical protein VF707_03795 [Ardenticatenaceae bacterium]|jgi:hypothetical protein
MARKIIVMPQNGERSLLTEVLADNEAQLQELMKDNPELLPIDDFEMAGPLMIVGRETTLPSGAVDLIGVARSGEILLVEFKTGPQNSDFRHVLAQLLDYGADLWRMSYDEFESTVASRYFSGERCQDSRVKGKRLLSEAAQAVWSDFAAEEAEGLRERLSRQLEAGAFHYVVVAQSFRHTMERTVEYMNAVMPAARFYVVELVRFDADGFSAFESRTILKPSVTNGGRPPIVGPDHLEGIEDVAYRVALQELLDLCRGLGLRFEWGPSGTSIRLRTPDRPEPLTIAWLFPNRRGWMGLQNLNLGFDESSAKHTPTVRPVLERYVDKVRVLPGVEPVKPSWLQAYHLKPDVTVRNQHQIAEILAELVQQVNEAP